MPPGCDRQALLDEVAADYAERRLARAPAISEDSDLMRQFETLFEFEETPDQLTAVAAIRSDLERESPMDRLLVGDVGYAGVAELVREQLLAVTDRARASLWEQAYGQVHSDKPTRVKSWLDGLESLEGENIRGVILPVGKGSIAIIGPREESLERVEKSVLDSVTWST